MILSIQPKYTMKIEEVSDSSQRNRTALLLITSYFPNYIYENGTRFTTPTTPEEGAEEEEEEDKEE
jgi:hypothetical protein